MTTQIENFELNSSMDALYEIVEKKKHYNSVKKHAFLIVPDEGVQFEELKIDDICMDFISKLPGPAGLTFKLINKNILVIEFEKCARLKFDEVSCDKCTLTRIKYSTLLENVSAYDLIGDLTK
jgi:hypothetical protein